MLICIPDAALEHAVDKLCSAFCCCCWKRKTRDAAHTANTKRRSKYARSPDNTDTTLLVMWKHLVKRIILQIQVIKSWKKYRKQADMA